MTCSRPQEGLSQPSCLCSPARPCRKEARTPREAVAWEGNLGQEHSPSQKIVREVSVHGSPEAPCSLEEKGSHGHSTAFMAGQVHVARA